MSCKTAKSPKENRSSSKINGRDLDGVSEEWKDIDISPSEYENIRDAFKKKEFCEMFSDYCKEMQDPETIAKYQEEMKEFEAQRGVEITFLNPTQHFVIKTSSNGKTKCFINIASNDQIDKPSNEVRYNGENNKKEMLWRLPYAQAEPRSDYDNKNNRCVVHDILFHPDALRLAETNSMLRRHLVNTACDAVEREFKVELDRTNLKFPKMKYKGIPKVTVKRKLVDSTKSVDLGDILEAQMPPMPEVKSEKPKIHQPKEFKVVKYTTPKYIIKHRRGIDMSEMTYELDAKLNVTIPKELIIEIELPLLKTTSDCTLDVTDKKLYLISETPAKYQLSIDLPYSVNDQEGYAKFDKSSKKLIVTLPVIKHNQRSLKDLYREDSGVESDPREEHSSLDSPTGKESPVQNEFNEEKEKKPLIEVLNSDELSCDEGFSKSDTNLNEKEFLRSDLTYHPVSHFDCNALENNLCFVLHIKNVDPQTVEHIKSDELVHLKFTSIGAGYYPTYYSFYFKLPSENYNTKIENVEAEAWDNNVILNLTINSIDNIHEYSAGLNENNLKTYDMPGVFNMYDKLAHAGRYKGEPIYTEPENHKFDIKVERVDNDDDSDEIQIEITSKKDTDDNDYMLNDDEKSSEENVFDENKTFKDTDDNQDRQKNNKNKKKKNKKRRSYSESACDDLKAINNNENIAIGTKVGTTSQNINIKGESSNNEDDNDAENLLTASRKQRSFSESRSISDCTPTFKGILKHYSRYDRSVSESCSSIDDHISYSTDYLNNQCESFSDIPEEGDERNGESGQSLSESCKKTVRFSEVIQKQLFRLDSSILGQRKKNQKKKIQKQRALQRRNSEGDTADYEEKINPSLQEKAAARKQNKNNPVKNNNSKSENNSKMNKQKNRTESESSDIFDFEI